MSIAYHRFSKYLNKWNTYNCKRVPWVVEQMRLKGFRDQWFPMNCICNVESPYWKAEKKMYRTGCYWVCQ